MDIRGGGNLPASSKGRTQFRVSAVFLKVIIGSSIIFHLCNGCETTRVPQPDGLVE